MPCPIHGNNCPGDDGGFFIDGNHPDDMYSVGPEPKPLKCWHGHTKRQVGCVSCVLVFDRPAEKK